MTDARAVTEAELRTWLTDYLITRIGCPADQIDATAPLKDLGVGSTDAVVLTGELSELLGRNISAVEFWEHPTLDALVGALAGTAAAQASAAALDASAGAGGGTSAVEATADEPIAVVGLSCRLPGGVSGPDEFWALLGAGGSTVGEVPADRWPQFVGDSPESAAALATTTRWGSFLADVAGFDADFFGVSPNEAAKMDPQQRLLLEVSQEALEHAGITPESLRHTRTGVFAGASLSEYGYLVGSDLSRVDGWSGTGSALSVIANRVSYHYDLRGPSMTIDTACSSSLVAIHLACRSLRSGESTLALAAGVNLLLAPAVTRSFDQVNGMSPTGRCHSFDAAADGYVRGEGCGVVVLKRLSDAERDGDRVLAVVRGTAVNQDGRSNGLMAPNPAAQMAVLRSAYADARLSPRDVDYVETHGTGTLLGDPIEARALGSVLGRGRSADAPLLIGAVKSNLGHLEAAAGVTGFIKAVLAVQHGTIPANLGFTTPNPHIAFDAQRLAVVATPTEWPAVDRARRAGVSAFGFGGTNAHVVIEQAGSVPAAPEGDGHPTVTTLVVTGRTPDRVAAWAEALADWFEGPGAGVALADAAHSLDFHRSRTGRFATVSARDHAQAIAGLRAVAAGQPAPGVVPVRGGPDIHGTVFVFSGQGSQWPGMGRRLLVDEPVFASAIDRLDPVFRAQVGFSLRSVLEAGEAIEGIDRIQPVLVGVQLALVELWRSYGVVPDAVVGHSMGEVAAAVVAGALSVADGLRVIATRSRLMRRSLSGQGAMALLELGADAAEELLQGFDGVTVAVVASPRQTVVAGSPEQIDAVVAEVSAQRLLARRVEVDVASHHSTVDPILDELRSELADLAPRSPSIPCYSTVRPGDTAPTMDAQYWVENLRRPVRFGDAIAAAGREFGTFVEISPHPILTYAIDDALAAVDHHTIGTLLRDTDEAVTFHTNVAATFSITPPPPGPHPPEPHPVLPPTPWRHTRHWVEAPASQGAGTQPRRATLLGGHVDLATSAEAHLWRARLLPEAKPYPGHHRIDGVEVVPASVLLHTLVTAAAEAGGTGIAEVRLTSPVLVDAARDVQVIADGGTLTLATRPADTDGAWAVHATALVSTTTSLQDRNGDAQSVAEQAILEHGTAADPTEVERALAAVGVEGRTFPWSVAGLVRTTDALVAELVLPDASTVSLIDAATHLACLVDGGEPRLMVPDSMIAVHLAADVRAPHGVVEVRRRDSAGGALVVDVRLATEDGRTCGELRGLRYIDVEGAQQEEPDAAPESIAHEITWQPWQPEPSSAGTPTVAVLGGVDDERDGLRDGLVRAGLVPADTASAAYVVYIANTPDGVSDADAAGALTADVAALVRDLARPGRRQPTRLWVLTRGVRDAVAGSAAQAALWGLAGVIKAEQPDLWGGLIDLPGAGDPIAEASVLASALPAVNGTVLSLQDGVLHSRVLAPLSGPVTGADQRLRPDATYLVTGGLGALGRLIAGWLADRGARRIVLAGRTGVPPRSTWDGVTDPEVGRRIAVVRDLERRGVAVEVAAIDVAAPGAVHELVARRDAAGAPPIMGVVHAAGLDDSALVTDLDTATIRRVLAPKVAGGQALHEAFPPGSLDFFVATASAGAVFGVPGQGAYAAANAYLDGLAAERHATGCHSLSLDWVAWHGLGFAAGAGGDVVAAELARLGSRPLHPSEAFAAWEFAARHDIAQAVMVPLPGQQPATGADSGQPATGGLATAWSDLSPEQVVSTIEAGLREILARELRLTEAELASDLPFAELGLNSLMAMSIRRDAERLVGTDLSVTMLWNHPTIGSLAGYLAEKVRPADVAPATAENVESDTSDSLLDSLFDSVEATADGGAL